MLWWFWMYSFLGYLIEKVFAAATHSLHQVRKCFLLLPFCPVYGLGMLAVLSLPEELLEGIRLIFLGGVIATAVEYAVHWLYDRFLGVMFWDYRGVFGNLQGRVCVPFGVAWGILSASAVWYVHPAVERLAEQIPAEMTYVCLLLFTADAVCTVFFLRETRDIDRLRLSCLLRENDVYEAE